MTSATEGNIPAELQELIARVRGASGPDRELDAEIAVTLSGDPRARVVNLAPHSIFASVPGWYRTSDNISYNAPEFTASVDAALALVERVLPGWTVANINGDDTKRWWAELREGHQTSFNRVATAGPLPTPALALVLALLHAVSASSTPQPKDPS